MGAEIQWGGHAWRLYDGGGALGQEWSADHVAIDPVTGRLRILNAGGIAGGVAMTNADKVYGEWVVRYRMTQGIGSKYAILLWPASGMRPEIDFAEDTKSDPTRTIVTSTLHPTMNNADSIHHKTSGNFSHFHDLGVRWQKGLLEFLLDGKVWSSIQGGIVPTDPHHLAIQTYQYDHTAPPTTLVVDRVTIT